MFIRLKKLENHYVFKLFYTFKHFFLLHFLKNSDLIEYACEKQAFLPMEGVMYFEYSVVSRPYGESQEAVVFPAWQGGSRG